MLKNKSNLVLFLLVFIVSFVPYLLTLAPTVYLEDSGELISAAYSLGVAHPSGYPLYVILGKLFSFLPFGSIAYNINLMSAFFGALTGALLFLIIQRIILGLKVLVCTHKLIRIILYYIIPATTALILNFGYIFWSQSVIAEVYTLNSFLLSLIILLLLIWREKNRSTLNDPLLFSSMDSAKQALDKQIKNDKPKNNNQYLLWAAFLFGLSLTNHQMMLLFLPAFLIFVLMVDRRIIFDYKLMLSAIGLFFVGLSLYIFIILRTKYGHPDFVWGNPYNWETFKYHILRKQYKDFGNFSFKTLFDSSKLLYINDVFKNFLVELTFPGLILSVLGFIIAWFKDKKNWLLLTLIFVINSFFIIILRQGEYSVTNDLIYQVYYLPAISVLVIFMGIAFSGLTNLLFKAVNKFKPFFINLILVIVMLTFIFIPFSYMVNNYAANNKSDFYFVDQYSRDVLNSLLPNAKLFIYTDQPAMDSVCFSLMYQQVVNDLRPDVKFINVANIRGKFYIPVGDIFNGYDILSMPDNDRKTKFVEILWQYNQSNSPIYIFHSLGIGLEKELVTRSNGWVFRVYEDLDTAKQDDDYYQNLKLVDLDNLEDSNLINNLFYRDMISDYYYARTALYQETNQKDQQKENLIKAIDYDVSPFSSNYNLFIQHRSIWDGNKPEKEIKTPPSEILIIN